MSQQTDGLLLVGRTSKIAFTLLPGRSYRLGRSLTCEFVIDDPTVSRTHAQVEIVDGGGGLTVQDLGSANGTRLNGTLCARGSCQIGDSLHIGSVELLVQGLMPRERVEDASADDLPGTIVREIPGDLTEGAVLQRLLEIARQLSGVIDVDAVLAKVARLAFEVARVERVSILLGEDVSELTHTISHTRVGDTSVVMPPRSILARAFSAQGPLIIDDIDRIPQLASQSVVLQRVRSAVCVPLRADGDRILGVVYADHSSAALGEVDAQALFALAGLAAVTVARVQYAAELTRETVRRTHLSRFFSPDIAQVLSSDPEVAPHGERHTVTVLFSDIRRFSQIAAQMTPERLARLLTEYFGEMADIVFAHGGTLDKFLGDGILAVWGALPTHLSPGTGALEAAQSMLDVLPALNARWEKRGDPPLTIGIGLDRGEAFVGTLGNQRRLDYTVLGDPVNMASRLSGVAGGEEILITEAVRASLPPGVDLVKTEVAVRGALHPVSVYRIGRPCEGGE